jgi:hypothetical protein
VFFLPDFSRFFPVCVWILPFAIFPVPVVLLPLPLFVPFVLSALDSHHNSGAAVIKIFRPQRLNNGGTPKFHGLKRLRAVLCAPLSALGQPAQLHRIRLPRLHRRTDLLVRRPLASEVLRVKRAESGSDRRANPHNAFFHVWPKKGNPKITPEKQLRAAHRGWASRTLHAIVLHLLQCCCCTIHHATSARRMTVLIHLPLQTREFARLDVIFFGGRPPR